jgi:PAS domain S-box-containing protein
MQKEILKIHADLISKIITENVNDVVVVLDTDLNYLFANDIACKLLEKEKEELEGKNLLVIFPNLIASKSHRHMLQALSGKDVKNARSEGTFTRNGAIYESSYYPLKRNGKVEALLVVTKTLYFPEA